MTNMLTNEQRTAVEDRGHGLLVSAAAGSGKTRVLVERLFSYVENDGANIDDFLIITYTRAAAAELRGKIAAALSERLRDDPGNSHLQRQLLRVYRADIKTVDAFCTALLRENCHLLGEDEQHRTLRPDFRVLDEQDASVLRNRVLSRTLDEFYESLLPDDGGTLLADTLGAGRDDRSLAALVMELYDKVQAQPYPEQWLLEQESHWENVPQKIDETPYAELLLRHVRNKSLHWASLFKHAAAEMAEDEKLNNSYAPDFLSVSGALYAFAEAACHGWDEARASQVAFPRLTAARKVTDEALKVRMKRLWDNGKASINKLTEFFGVSAAEAADDLRTMAPAMLALLRLTLNFSRAYRTEKRRRNAADFSDQEHEAIRLLIDDDGSPTELAKNIQDRYREIMVDEYQDANEVQNCIFEAVSRKGTNLFTVGDVKQSIYRFRLADPTIFLEHYNTYPHVAEVEKGKRAKIVLSRNFRSRAEVLDATNFVFNNILSVEMGELNYGADEMLYPGAEYPAADNGQTEFHLLDIPRKTEEGAHIRSSGIEADYVADYIRSMLDTGILITDPQTHTMRPIREEDIVILMRSPRARLAEYRRAAAEKSIRICADTGENYFSTVEVATVFALLQVLDNPRQDVPLIAVLRSPLFGFSADELALMRTNRRDGDFFDALKESETEKARQFLGTLRSLRESAQTMSVHRLLAHIYDRCNVLGVFGAMSGGTERRDNLLAFATLSEKFEQSGYRGLFAFVSHVRDLQEGKNFDAPKAAQNTEGVRVMSIHSSKGLEFPVVILADLAKGFNNMDFTGSVLVHPKHGLGPECVDLSRRIRYPTIARQAVEYTLRRETKAEEMRLLYVAMTRARDKLIMVHTQSGAAKHLADLSVAASCPVLPEAVDEAKCLGDWVLLPLLCRGEAEPLRQLSGDNGIMRATTQDHPWHVSVHSGVPTVWDEERKESLTPEVGQELTVDTSALVWRYPYTTATELSAKLTATQLKGRESDAEIAENAKLPPRLRSLVKPHFLEGKSKLTGAERGTALHLVMEHLDFSCGGSEASVRSQIDAMLARHLLTPEQAEAVDIVAIVRFLQSDLAGRILKSPRVEREYRFSILRSARDFDFQADASDEVLVQGVVDCFFEEDGALVVVDFKTDHITPSYLKERTTYYTPQLKAYASSLERILDKPVKEKLLYFFHTGHCVRVREAEA